MSTTLDSTTHTAERVATAFFDAYRARDVVGMADLCTDNADFNYVPFEMWGKQRVIRGKGKVHTIGRPIWTGLVQAFPNLTNEVTSLSANADGDVVAEVLVSGTQATTWGVLANRGQAFQMPNLFVLHVGTDGLIDAVTTYWDNAALYRQLGHAEVD
jgi:ketosteroid isomerase-like protein